MGPIDTGPWIPKSVACVFYSMLLVLCRFSYVRLCDTIAYSPPGSFVLGFSRQKYWRGGCAVIQYASNTQNLFGSDIEWYLIGGKNLIQTATVSRKIVEWLQPETQGEKTPRMFLLLVVWVFAFQVTFVSFCYAKSTKSSKIYLSKLFSSLDSLPWNDGDVDWLD